VGWLGEAVRRDAGPGRDLLMQDPEVRADARSLRTQQRARPVRRLPQPFRPAEAGVLGALTARGPNSQCSTSEQPLRDYPGDLRGLFPVGHRAG
jgi:hypothetical protein